PTITTQPKSVTTSAGSTAKFTVAASGTGLKYQWQWSFDGGKNWQNSSSATTGYNTATLQVTATEARNGYQYRCQVSNSAGSVTTSAATLTVVTKPTITTQPKSVTAAVNATAKFTVAASGTGLKYQWQWSFDGGKNWSNSSSATVGYNTATLQVTATEARNGYQYRCQVTNEAGAVTSSAATLTVSSSKPTITTQPKSVTAAVNTTAKFTVEATNATSYQWQWSFDGGSNWQNSSSATTGYNTATLQVTATETRNGYMYRCKVTNSAGTVTSSAATLTVVTKPTITTQPKSVTTSAGSTAKFTVAASGTGLKYQWQWSFDGGNNWQNSSSATTGYNTATLQVTATEARNGYMYRCKVTNSAGTVYTNAVTLTVK
ncbi:MAG: immunoglobulin domain-containing protein, partial [Clostridia bacterium]|nr:immunoglobulin domain-containing protein [Clostridia bacterium]